jgi:gallate dioxygenase
MAKIIGGFAVSHTPTIAFAQDAKKFDDPVWAPIFEGFRPVKEWLAEQKPDVILYVYNDHMTSFFTHYSHFALGVGEEYAPADEGGGQRDLPPIKGDPELAQHIANVMVANEFDLAYWQGMGLDHGAFSPLSVLLPHEHGWPCRLVPLQCGVLQQPIPKAKYDEAKAALDAYNKVREDAISQSIPFMNQTRFLYYTGYFDAAKR